jgi:2-oxoglutarate/2-oxoacid ferredoxin oxidoreductase subunit alpha
MKNRTTHIVIGGQAGQGMVTIGLMLSTCLVRNGYSILATQDYQSRIRGGHNTFSLRIGTEEIHAPQESIDLLVALEPATVELHLKDLNEAGMVVADEKWISGGPEVLKIPYDQLGPGKSLNMMGLGIIGALLGLPEPSLLQVVRDQWGHKNPSLGEASEKVLHESYEWIRNAKPDFPQLPPVAKKSPRLRLNGNEAIALGALSAGVKFAAYYPMTPATSIALTLTAQAESAGVIVEQAEDEIAAINMAIGASFAGAPSMVSTSGGGFALMVEGVSLAGMTETPLVIVVAQRPGPATGLPTRTEQADLNFVLHAGHGEFPRAVLAPGSVEECFHFTRRAFEWAEAFQTPIFLMTDQYMADSYHGVAPDEWASLKPVQAGSVWDGKGGTYRRFGLTENGISTRLLPGKTVHLVVADSDEHTEEGHITEDLALRKKMVEKRLRKGLLLAKQIIPPEYTGDSDPDLLLVTWGSTKGSVLEAADQLRRLGKSVASLCFSQVWPIDPESIIFNLKAAKMVVGIEGNATGQFSNLIRRETGFNISKRILRYDGLPITPRYIIKELGLLT